MPTRMMRFSLVEEYVPGRKIDYYKYLVRQLQNINEKESLILKKTIIAGILLFVTVRLV